MPLQNPPSLSRAEFSLACHHLDSRYRRATLGPLRKSWKLRLCTALDGQFALDGTYATYVQIIKPIDSTLDPEDLSFDFGNFSLSERGVGKSTKQGSKKAVEGESVGADLEMEEAEAGDEAAMRRPAPATVQIGQVTFEIHLHPTYQVPCLWFSLSGLPPDEPALDIDTVFRHLVPDVYKSGLRGNGSVGGISVDHHPITGLPCFFIHPCLLGDALAKFECSEENYLMIWIGLVGGCVGLWVPQDMATS